MRHFVWTVCITAAFASSACTQDDSNTTKADNSSGNSSGNTSGNTSGELAKKVTVAVGAGKELCFEAKKDDTVVFRFEADQPLQFDLHYHAEDETYFPIPEHTTAAEKGEYLVPRDNTYCLQWTNGENTAVELSADIEGAGLATWY